MLKSKKRLISALTAAVVTVTAVFGMAVSAEARAAAQEAGEFTKDTKVSAVYTGVSFEDRQHVFVDIGGVVIDTPTPNVSYAIYYVNRNDATGVFGSWNTAVVRDNKTWGGSSYFEIPAPAKGTTYYITVLPFTDVPSRQYGQFSPYVKVNSDDVNVYDGKNYRPGTSWSIYD